MDAGSKQVTINLDALTWTFIGVVIALLALGVFVDRWSRKNGDGNA